MEHSREPQSEPLDLSDVTWGRYLAGELGDAERVAFEARLANAAREGAPVSLLQRAWESPADLSRHAAQFDPLWNAIAVEIAKPAVQKKRVRRSHWVRFGIPGAVAALAVFAAFGLSHQASRGALEREYVTHAGERATIQLPDGSSMALGPATRVQYHVDTRGRTVMLDGLASFTVAAVGDVPFVVHSGSSRVRVLGTQFVIRRYADDDAAHVVVQDGKVSAESKRMSMVLTHGMGATLHDSVVTAMPRHVTGAVTRWTEGLLEFSETPIPAMLQTIGRWYGYRFELADSALAREHVTVILAVDKPEETLEVLKELLDVQAVFRGDTVVLRPKPRNGNVRKNQPVPAQVARDEHVRTLEAGR